jgi:hypothetical protein
MLLFCSLALNAIVVKGARQAEVSAEEYAVYSAYLNSIEINPNDGKLVKLIVLEDYTVTIPKSCSYDNIAKHYERISKDEFKLLFEDVRAKSIESTPLKRLFKIRHDYVFLGVTGFEAFFKVEDIDGWEEFYKKYPNSSGYVSFSRVSFNATLTKAMMFRRESCGSLCDSGIYIFFEKVDGKWRDVDKINCWIS